MALNFHLNATDFFNRLTHDAKRIAEEEAQKTANEMLFTLKHRFPMKGGGRSPLWNPSEFDPNQQWPKSKQSYRNWSIQPRANGEYWLTNDSSVEWSKGTFFYPKAFLTGVGWSARVQNGEWKRLVRHDGKIFSKWMPRGINPWLEYKRTMMEKKVLQRFDKEL